jgi:DNA polymerase/3'-5' exonuclease PolX
LFQQKGVGKAIAEKIDEILSTGHLSKLDKIRDDADAQAIDLLSRVHGVGCVNENPR